MSVLLEHHPGSMPTVVLLDVSLSMIRRVQTPDDQDFQRRHLAIRGLYTFFDHLASKFKLEFTALVAFSSLWEIVVPFTRDYEALKQGCMSVEVYDKTCFGNALSGVATHVVEEWGTSVPCQVVMVTDGSTGSGYGSLRELLDNKEKTSEEPNPLPFPFPCKLHVVCIATASELSGSLMIFQQLCDMCGGGGSVYVPDAPWSIQSVQNVFNRLAQTHYVPYEGTLSCGHLSSRITLSPPPDFSTSWSKILETYRKSKPEGKIRKFPNEIVICGFLDIPDVGSPPCLSRHLTIPVGSALATSEKHGDSKSETSDGSKEQEEDGKTPSFCVLLHGSLKVEKMIAIVQLE